MSSILPNTTVVEIIVPRTVVEVTQPVTTVVEIIKEGQQGPPGSEGATHVLAAGQVIGGYRVIKAVNGLAFYPDTTIASDGLLVTGISENAAIVSDPVTVRSDGYITDMSWNWTPGAVYCGATGLLTQTIPSSGWVLQVATAVSQTKISVEIRQPIMRS